MTQPKDELEETLQKFHLERSGPETDLLISALRRAVEQRNQFLPDHTSNPDWYEKPLNAELLSILKGQS